VAFFYLVTFLVLIRWSVFSPRTFVCPSISSDQTDLILALVEFGGESGTCRLGNVLCEVTILFFKIEGLNILILN
jgi:hypothetical protein